ncbi:dihydrolipoamide acetyltransferase family protein [Ralstonia mannitolilytica]|uniref:Dihydrolipoyllysine-residue acetyltransferase component of pyruvate dehydrogenase complex n=1 Tax=Ralstonia mannitolilytica TaxID=105219 RepID=A0AAD2EEB2_9RALS|nr:dihydrolipoamide acetyltransferase family protein [Ralstonia mannitolilytica]ANA32434.1 dihydrolipoyllysine acetyltransferase [Ralstonia mannitolilytica]MBY4718937.1 2-oxo acid dehydrogenase subunit E2 [Ralstonia mannitolilytica]CAJ0680017.1 Dihydrolipoyllysine-residue acetyltransferase component of pyruvate dehydrogenase complex [Ralstonia mannitolilytica]CAJ0680058.1 Dihydrolipoyllysine-residue acetyltransferase component of pyruvate dehydrogenase complex [Ralstonia mannitolilytica]CAJ069
MSQDLASVPEAGTRRVVPLAGLRGAIARSMGAAWQVPRVAQSIEVDATRLELAVQALQQRLGPQCKVTLTAFVLRAVALTLREHPRLNARVLEKEVELMPDVNIGLAVSLDEGLMVPVLRQVDTKPVADIAAESRRLAEGARAGTLSPGSYQHGTFTVTNLGMTGIDSFTPIINVPQVAILGVTRVARRVVVRNDSIVIAPMMGLHLVFDHRAVDGYPAARFLTDLRTRLETTEGL